MFCSFALSLSFAFEANAILPGRTVLLKDQAAQLPRRGRVTKTFPIPKDGYITIRINETKGRKIALRAVNNNIQVFRDEASKTLRARFAVKRGELTLHIINRNLAMEKNILYSATLWDSIALFQRSRQSKALAQDERLTVPRRGRAAKTFQLDRAGAVTVTASEASGAKIGFEIMSNGKKVFDSGTRAGTVTGRANVKRGVLTVHFVNKHLMKDKQITVTIRVE
jgi:hypothetical protein